MAAPLAASRGANVAAAPENSSILILRSSGDVTEEFPLPVTKLSPYYDR
jgi:hypothetical protein